jgi:hypothetical protein
VKEIGSLDIVIIHLRILLNIIRVNQPDMMVQGFDYIIIYGYQYQQWHYAVAGSTCFAPYFREHFNVMKRYLKVVPHNNITKIVSCPFIYSFSIY